MALLFGRKSSGTRRSARRATQRAAAQGCLWDPTVVGRSFAQAATTFRSGDQALQERLKELELRRRRAQIKARRVLEEPETPARPTGLPFAS